MSVTLSLFAGAGAQFFDNNGNVLSGGKIYTYYAGTTTPLATYTTNSGSVFHTNPIVLNAAGRVPSGGEIWLDLGIGYKFVLETSTNVLIATYDNIPSSAQPPAANDADSIMYEQGRIVTAGNFVIGSTYRIASVGTTNFTLIGAVSNTSGVHFTATGVGSGTGTAEFSQTVEAKLQQFLTPQDFGTTVDTSSIAIGFESAQLSTGIGNTSYGYRSLKANTTGQFSTAVGSNNQTAANGLGFNTSVGYGTMFNTTVGTSNVALGFEALHDNQAGSGNTALGYASQRYGLANGGVSDPNNVTAVGTFALFGNRAGNVVGVGYEALKVNQGVSNTAVGFRAGLVNTTGAYSVLIGENAGANKTVGEYDTQIGFESGLAQTTSIGFNTYLGARAGFYNTTAAQNVGVGYLALGGTSGSNGGGLNVAVGNQAMGNCTAVSTSVAIGAAALRYATANNNTAVGGFAGVGNTSGQNNTIVGASALRGTDATPANTGTGNTALGFSALFNTVASPNDVTGDNNTAVGLQALGQETSGDFNTAIGYRAGYTQTAGYDNTTNLGKEAVCTGSNQVQLGNSATTTYAYGAVQNRSDVRDKADVRDTTLGLSFIQALRPVDFKWDFREDYFIEEEVDTGEKDSDGNAVMQKQRKPIVKDGSKKRSRFHHGLIAQEVKAACEVAGVDFGGYQDHSVKGGQDVLSVGYEELIAPLIKAVQELAAEVAALKAR
jgi:hypothetical protein